MKNEQNTLSTFVCGHFSTPWIFAQFLLMQKKCQQYTFHILFQSYLSSNIQKDFIYQLLMNPVLIKTTANLYEGCLHSKLYKFIYAKILSINQYFIVIINTTYIIYPNDGLLIGDAYDDLDFHIPQHSKGPVMPQLLLTSIHSHNSINGNSIQWRIIVTMANTNGDFEQKMWSIVILGRLRSPMIDWIYY